MARWAKNAPDRIRDPFLDGLGIRVKQARLLANLNQTQLANMLNTSKTWIVLIESGQQNAQINGLRKLAEVLGVSLKSLLPDDDSPVMQSVEEEISVSFDELIQDLTRSLATTHKLNTLRKRR